MFINNAFYYNIHYLYKTHSIYFRMRKQAIPMYLNADEPTQEDKTDEAHAYSNVNVSDDTVYTTIDDNEGT